MRLSYEAARGSFGLIEDRERIEGGEEGNSRVETSTIRRVGLPNCAPLGTRMAAGTDPGDLTEQRPT